MSDDRTARAWAAVGRHARRDSAQATLRHLCLACTEALSARGTCVALTSSLGDFEPVIATDPTIDELEEWQATVGEGPGRAALAAGAPVLVGDLGSRSSMTRWPAFAPFAIERGTRAVFSFPVGAGGIRLGVLDVYRDATGALDPDELGDAFAFSDLAMLLALDERDGVQRALEHGPDGDGAGLRSAEVHQAAGMISVQLDIPVLDALLRLRARAYAENARMTDLARAVVERRLLFRTDGDSSSEHDPETST